MGDIITGSLAIVVLLIVLVAGVADGFRQQGGAHRKKARNLPRVPPPARRAE